LVVVLVCTVPNSLRQIHIWSTINLNFSNPQTGWNIERMNSYYPIEKFHKVYLIDLTPSLCRIARERFQRRGWSNVVVLCEDAATFDLPGLPDMTGKIGLITMSYSRKFEYQFPEPFRLSSQAN
jgi:betaine lipid synthase